MQVSLPNELHPQVRVKSPGCVASGKAGYGNTNGLGGSNMKRST